MLIVIKYAISIRQSKRNQNKEWRGYVYERGNIERIKSIAD